MSTSGWLKTLAPNPAVQAAVALIGRSSDLDETAGLDLRFVDLQGAELRSAFLQKALLQHSRFEGATLVAARLEGANLGGARLEGVNPTGTWFGIGTYFLPATLHGAGLHSVDFGLLQIDKRLSEAFGDGSVKLPPGLQAGEGPLAHWASEVLASDEFYARWRAWQAEIG